uniref:transposase n=1 Tax=Psychromonas hadalis TaxID=211669 RepID=UPI00048D5153
QDHLSDPFPKLCGYAAFVHRVNKLSNGFIALISFLQAKKISADDDRVYLIDSFPITLAKNNYAYTAKVAPERASKSYNSTKKMYYYGVKAHVVARKREASLPDIEIIFIEEAKRQDGPVFDQIRPMLTDNLLFGDQAYKRPDEDNVELEQELKVLTPIKKQRGRRSCQQRIKNIQMQYHV